MIETIKIKEKRIVIKMWRNILLGLLVPITMWFFILYLIVVKILNYHPFIVYILTILSVVWIYSIVSFVMWKQLKLISQNKFLKEEKKVENKFIFKRILFVAVILMTLVFLQYYLIYTKNFLGFILTMIPLTLIVFLLRKYHKTGII